MSGSGVSKPAIVKLSAPITVGLERVAELAIRPPTGRDVREAGNPLNLLAGKSASRVDDEKMHAMIGQLAGIPPSSVDQLSFADFNACAQEVLLFLAPADLASSTDTSNAPPSGATSVT